MECRLYEDLIINRVFDINKMAAAKECVRRGFFSFVEVLLDTRRRNLAIDKLQYIVQLKVYVERRGNNVFEVICRYHTNAMYCKISEQYIKLRKFVNCWKR